MRRGWEDTCARGAVHVTALRRPASRVWRSRVRKMGKILISLSDEVDKQFREFVIERFGKKKGAISIAAELAIKAYLKAQ